MGKLDDLVLVVTNEWDSISRMLGPSQEIIENELNAILRRVDADAADPGELIRAIIGLFDGHPEIHEKIRQLVASTAPNTVKGGNGPAGYLSKDRYTLIPVFYGTDRNQKIDGDEELSFGPERGDLSYGIAKVSIPDDHRMGEIEKPKWWKLEFKENPEKHVILESINGAPLSDFEEMAKAALRSATKREILLFVHGYNVGFGDAAMRTAQIAYDLHFEGLAALYSWPSEGSTHKYTVDEASVAWSRPRFIEFVTVLRNRVGADTIHILAHSMGSRLVAETLEMFNSASKVAEADIGQVAFAAPDVDASTFKDLSRTFKQKAERITLYASSNDLALKTSKLVHKYTRAGEAGLDLALMDEVDTVDASALDTSLVGHSYYGDNRTILADLFELVRRGSPPQDRHGLVLKNRYGSPYWLFRP